MKERPILFTPENAQKCHDGTKTQTRRLNGLDIINKSPEGPGGWRLGGQSTHNPLYWHFSTPHISEAIKCPYGIVGDRLWIREPFHICNGAQRWKDGTVLYRGEHGVTVGGTYVDLAKWTPSIHMPRWASRITLEITEIRVQRLQAIIPDDARAEGCDDEICAKGAFQELWESINGAGSWALNPWVWAITFKWIKEEASCHT